MEKTTIVRVLKIFNIIFPHSSLMNTKFTDDFPFDFCRMSSKDLCLNSLDDANTIKLFNFGSPRFEGRLHSNTSINKKTILWIPSHGRRSCSLVNYLSILSELQKDFNIVVSFPSGIYEDFCFLRWKLEKYIKIVVNNRDSSSLMDLADFVFCDYGGSLLTSIYFEKNICLLNTKKENISIIERNFGKNSPEMVLRKDIVSFNTTDTYKDFLNVLNDCGYL